MEDEIEIVEFDEKLYLKNIAENDFADKIIDGIGSDENADN